MARIRGVAAGGARLAVLATLLAAPLQARAGDVTAFATWQSPGPEWSTGYGAGLASGLLPFLQLEAEAARSRYAKLDDGSISYFTGSLLLAPTLGVVTPYGGLGFGLYRESLRETSETNVFRALVLGAKVKLGGLLVLKGEYRKYTLSGDVLIPFDERYSLGAGISF
jgi:hypothetical protein